MNKRKLLISTIVLVLLVGAIFATTRVAALRSSGTVGNQVFYSPSIESLVPRPGAEAFPNQVFYSPFVGSLVNRDRASTIPNQVFYSPMIEGFTR